MGGSRWVKRQARTIGGGGVRPGGKGAAWSDTELRRGGQLLHTERPMPTGSAALPGGGGKSRRRGKLPPGGCGSGSLRRGQLRRGGGGEEEAPPGFPPATKWARHPEVRLPPRQHRVAWVPQDRGCHHGSTDRGRRQRFPWRMARYNMIGYCLTLMGGGLTGCAAGIEQGAAPGEDRHG